MSRIDYHNLKSTTWYSNTNLPWLWARLNREWICSQMPSKRSARYWIFQNTSWHCKYFWPLRNTLGKDESPLLHAPISPSLLHTHTLTHTHGYRYTAAASLHRKTPLWVIHRLTIQIPTYAALPLFRCVLRNGRFPNSSTRLPTLFRSLSHTM